MNMKKMMNQIMPDVLTNIRHEWSVRKLLDIAMHDSPWGDPTPVSGDELARLRRNA